jgi:hypothetical protein
VTLMSERELRRAGVLAQVESGAWTVMDAAQRMEMEPACLCTRASQR